MIYLCITHIIEVSLARECKAVSDYTVSMNFKLGHVYWVTEYDYSILHGKDNI